MGILRWRIVFPSHRPTDRGAKTFLLQRQWLHLCSSLSLSTPQDADGKVSLPVCSIIQGLETQSTFQEINLKNNFLQEIILPSMGKVKPWLTRTHLTSTPAHWLVPPHSSTLTRKQQSYQQRRLQGIDFFLITCQEMTYGWVTLSSVTYIFSPSGLTLKH